MSPTVMKKNSFLLLSYTIGVLKLPLLSLAQDATVYTECYPNGCCHPDGCSTTPLDCSAADEHCTESCETILDCSSNVCKFNTELQDCEIVDSDGNPVEAAEASCDMLLCAPNHQLIDTDERGCGGTCQPSCVPNCESWFDGCNTCQCDEETNLVTSCTKMFCEDHNYAHSYCLDTSPPSQGYCPEGCVRWYDGCNTCKCGGGEFGGYCTEMACSQQQQPRCNQWEGHKPDSDPDNSTNLSDFDLFGELNAPSARMMVGSFVCMMSVMGFMSIHFQ